MKKNYKIILLFCLLLGGMLSDASAKRKNSFVRKDEIFSYYSKFVSEVWDISWKKPKGFTDLMKSETWAFGKKDPYSLFYRLTVESVDKDCLIMYPELKMVTPFPDIAWTEKCGKPEFLRNYVMMEVGDSLIEERLTVFSGTEAPMNADTVFVFRTALKNVYKGYSYCTSIYAYKEGRPPMIFRCFFTEKGKAKEKRYLSKFCKSVNYGNNKEWKMDADLNIFIENPLLGIGQGLRTPYVLNHLDEDTLNNTEVKMWINNIKNKGLINISIPMLGEYTSRLSETGIISFVLFMAPILLLLFRLLKYIIQNSKDTFVIFFTIAYIECLLTGIGTTLNELYYFWILLGFGYALVYVKNACNNKVEEVREY